MIRSRDAPKSVISAALCTLLLGCVQRHPIELGTPEPWQDTYEAERDAQIASNSSVGSPEPEGGDESEESVDGAERGGWGVVADVIAVPFRSVGWLIRKLV